MQRYGSEVRYLWIHLQLLLICTVIGSPSADCKPPRVTRRSIGPLVERLTNPSYLREVYNGLSNVEKNALLDQLFHGGEGFFHQSVLCQERHQLTPSQLRLGLTRLRQLGLLFAHESYLG